MPLYFFLTLCDFWSSFLSLWICFRATISSYRTSPFFFSLLISFSYYSLTLLAWASSLPSHILFNSKRISSMQSSVNDSYFNFKFNRILYDSAGVHNNLSSIFTYIQEHKFFFPISWTNPLDFILLGIFFKWCIPFTSSANSPNTLYSSVARRRMRRRYMVVYA